MINKERVQLAINVMERAGKVDMGSWHDSIANKSEEEIRASELALCFAGWLVLSDEFRSTGGESCPENGIPIYKGYKSASAVAEWLGATDWHAEIVHLLVLGYLDVGSTKVENWYTELGYEMEYDPLYDELSIVTWNEGKWTAEDVNKVLKALLELGSDD